LSTQWWIRSDKTISVLHKRHSPCVSSPGSNLQKHLYRTWAVYM
jgi:hypothetical protein